MSPLLPRLPAAAPAPTKLYLPAPPKPRSPFCSQAIRSPGTYGIYGACPDRCPSIRCVRIGSQVRGALAGCRCDRRDLLPGSAVWRQLQFLNPLRAFVFGSCAPGGHILPNSWRVRFSKPAKDGDQQFLRGAPRGRSCAGVRFSRPGKRRLPTILTCFLSVPTVSPSPPSLFALTRTDSRNCVPRSRRKTHTPSTPYTPYADSLFPLSYPAASGCPTILTW